MYNLTPDQTVQVIVYKGYASCKGRNALAAEVREM